MPESNLRADVEAPENLMEYEMVDFLSFLKALLFLPYGLLSFFRVDQAINICFFIYLLNVVKRCSLLYCLIASRTSGTRSI